MVLKFRRFGKLIRNNFEVLKCGGGKGWTRSVRPIMSEMKYCKRQGREEYNMNNNKKVN
jgi:hypothetical protein